MTTDTTMEPRREPGRAAAIRADLAALAAEELEWEGPLPRGPLADALDSLELMTLVVAVEDHFLVVLEPVDEGRIDTVDDLVDLIAEKTAEDEHG